MIKTNQTETRLDSGASTKALICWSRDAHPRSLRVELQDNRFFLFPNHHLLFTEFQSGDAEESLRLSLTTHEVRITGRNLRELALAFQKLTVEWIKEMPPRLFSPTLDDVFIHSINVQSKRPE
jgi:hypothetical protein